MELTDKHGPCCFTFSPEKADSHPLGGMTCTNCNKTVILDSKGRCPACGFDNSKYF